MYEKITQYGFAVNGMDVLVSSIYFRDTRPFVTVEDASKNGQEDAHMIGELIFDKGVWAWYDDSYSSFVFYEGSDYANGIVDYLNKKRHPEL